MNQDSKDEYLVDYKWFCFNGEPKVMYICCDAGKRPEIAFFDMEYNRLNMRDSDPQMKESPEKPHHFDEMMELSRKLSKGMPHVRVDFYIDSHDKLYIGEMTFFHSAGYSRFCPEDKEKMMGDYLDISNIK